MIYSAEGIESLYEDSREELAYISERMRRCKVVRTSGSDLVSQEGARKVPGRFQQGARKVPARCQHCSFRIHLVTAISCGL